MAERDPTDPNDIRPFEIHRGLTPNPAWVIHVRLGGGVAVALRAQSYEECVEAIAPVFLPERRLLARIAELEAQNKRLTSRGFQDLHQENDDLRARIANMENENKVLVNRSIVTEEDLDKADQCIEKLEEVSQAAKEVCMVWQQGGTDGSFMEWLEAAIRALDAALDREGE